VTSVIRSMVTGPASPLIVIRLIDRRNSKARAGSLVSPAEISPTAVAGGTSGRSKGKTNSVCPARPAAGIPVGRT
jgi:hypothetical protein